MSNAHTKLPDTCRCIFVLLHAPSRVVAYNIAKVYIRSIASSLKLFWHGNMEWNMEEIFSMEWKIFSMKWKKTVGMEYEKIIFHFTPYHALPAWANRFLKLENLFV